MFSIATTADIPALVDLLALLFSQEQEFSVNRPAHEQGLHRIITTPALGHIMVAKHQQQPIGMVSLLYSVSTALGGRVAWLEDMIIDPRHRQAGLGSELLRYAIHHAQQQGCQRITLLTDHDNIVAQNFYQKQGFQPSSMLPMRLFC